MFTEIFSARGRAAAVKRRQDAYLRRLLSDREFAAEQSLHPRHACIGQWIELSHGRRALELGCGPGRYVAMLASLGFNVTGVDPLLFDTWQSFATVPNARLISGVRAERLSFEDGGFDHVSCLGALLYFDDPAQALREIWRVLRQGGRLVLRTPNRNNLYTRRTGRRLDPASKNLYLLDELRELLTSTGFIVRADFQYGYFPPVLPNLYWYVANVYFGSHIEEQLNDMIPATRRINNIVHCLKP